jgi:hypothetical protein
MENCKYCKGTGKALMLFNYVDCECVDKEKTFVVASDIAKIVINNGRVIYFDSNGAKIGVV